MRKRHDLFFHPKTKGIMTGYQWRGRRLPKWLASFSPDPETFYAVNLYVGREDDIKNVWTKVKGKYLSGIVEKEDDIKNVWTKVKGKYLSGIVEKHCETIRVIYEWADPPTVPENLYINRQDVIHMGNRLDRSPVKQNLTHQWGLGPLAPDPEATYWLQYKNGTEYRFQAIAGKDLLAFYRANLADNTLRAICTHEKKIERETMWREREEREQARLQAIEEQQAQRKAAIRQAIVERLPEALTADLSPEKLDMLIEAMASLLP